MFSGEVKIEILRVYDQTANWIYDCQHSGSCLQNCGIQIIYLPTNSPPQSLTTTTFSIALSQTIPKLSTTSGQYLSNAEMKKKHEAIFICIYAITG